MSVIFRGEVIDDVVKYGEWQMVLGAMNRMVTVELLMQDQADRYWHYAYYARAECQIEEDAPTKWALETDTAERALTHLLADEPILHEERLIAIGTEAIRTMASQGITIHDGFGKLQTSEQARAHV